MSTVTKKSLLTLTGASLALTFAACGSGSTEATGEDTAAAASGDTRTVTDATGAEVEVPTDPQKVVTTHYAGTQAVTDLGATPVGQGNYTENIVPEDLVYTLAEVPVVANDAGEPDMEKIVGLEPDLVLVPNTTEEDAISQLKEIAPVYVFTLRGGDRGKWSQRAEEVGDALNKTAEVEKLSTDFEARQKEIAEEYEAEIEGTTVGVLGAFEENNAYIWGSENMMGTILTPLGFEYSADEDTAVEGEKLPEATVSNEKLPEVLGDADVLFTDSDLRGENKPFMTTLQETSLYQQLPAVEAGHDFPAGKNTVAGYGDANYTLDMVEDALTEIRAEG